MSIQRGCDGVEGSDIGRYPAGDRPHRGVVPARSDPSAMIHDAVGANPFE